MDNKKLKQTICGEQPRHRNSFVSYLLRVFLLLAVMVCGAGNVAWGQDATFNMGQTTDNITVNGCKLTFAGGGIDDVNTQNGVTTLSTKTENNVKTSASMTLTGQKIRYIKITFADDVNTYNLKWGGSWNETINANNDVSGKGTLILVSNSGSNNIKIINDIVKGTESTPIKKVEVYYWNDGYTPTGDQTATNATKTISNAITWKNNTVDLSKINVVGTYASFGTNGKGAMLKNSADNYLSIKFKDPADLSGISYFRIDGENVDKTNDSHVFDLAQFICEDENGGTVNVDKYSNPAKVDFTGDSNADQRAKLAKVKEIRLYNNNCEGTFSINSIKFIYQYTLTWINNDIPTGCDAWYTIGSDETHLTATSKVIEAGTEVTFHGTDTGNDHKMINGWYNPNGEYWGWGATKVITVSSDFSVKPDFQPCFRVFANAENGATATVTGGSGKKYFQNASGLSFSTTVPEGYTFDGWYDADEKKGTTNPWNYGDYTSDIIDLNLTAKFTPNNTLSKPKCNHVSGSDGSNYFDITKLYTNLAITGYSQDDGRTITVPTTGGNMSYFFDNEYNFGDLKSWTISDNRELQARINSIEYLDANGNQLAICYTDAGNRTLQDNENDNNLRKKLDKVKEIRINFKSSTPENPITEAMNYQFNWICFTFEHADRVKPVLSEGTATDMRVFTGENLILANGSGFWRQYTDNTYKTVKSDGFIPTNEWEKRYEIPANKLTKDADYYFRVVDEITCALGYTHSSKAVDVHVKVTDPINTVDVNGKKREYATYVPDGISGEVGVIFSLHGASNDYWNGRVDFNAIADEQKTVKNKKFIVVYPRGLMRQLRGTERGWETYTESNTEDVEFFKAIVTELKKTYSVDMSRIYLAGFSNGGMMAYKAAHQAGDFFAAFASVGGFPVNESHLFHAGSQPTPFIHIQGAADAVFPSATYDLSTIAHNMTYRNGAHFNPYDEGHNSDGGVVPAHENVKREIHVADNGGAAYFLYTIAGMGHTWSYNWDGNAGDDVAQSIWNFFDYSGKVNNIDKTLKFRVNDASNFWANAGNYGFVKGANASKDVLSYGGASKTNDNKNIYHSLQFNGGINGAQHFLKLNVETEEKTTEKATEDPNDDYFLVKLTKTGATTPVFSKRYQAGNGRKDLYINFVALPGFNEYKLEVTKSKEQLVVKVHGMEFYSGRCEDKGTNDHPITENPVYFYKVEQVLTGMNPIYQPVYGKSYNGIAKEYLPIAEIPVGKLNDKGIALPSDINNTDYQVIENNLKNSDDENAAVMTSLLSTVIASKDWTENAGRYTATITGNKLFSLAQSGKDGEDTSHKSNNAFIFVPNEKTYTIDKVKGINISQLGRAKMPEYLNGTEGSFPTKGMIAIKLQGTLDFYLLAQNEVTYTGTDFNAARRTLKVYYTNDQLDGELKELKEWQFFGTRSENAFNDKNGNSLAPLSAGVRLPQLGKDGTCTVFITYEGNGQGQSFSDADSDHDKIWIKGFVIKRPDLKVTIGRTDSKYSSQEYNGENNTKCTRFGENKPYVWSFENVGFNNTRRRTVDGKLEDDTKEKKINMKDGRTYVCGGTDDSMDHVLLYSDGASTEENDKVQFDGRVRGKEHIEFLKASKYDIPEATDDRKIYDPIQSNGLKVNVTGSGWFKIQCAAPNGPVNMKVYTQPNYGGSYISLLREFRVEKTSSDTDWKEYTVYLKSRGIHTGNNGFWDGTTEDAGKEEIMRQSLFVVFDNIDNVSYDEGHPQLNIHQLSWLNEEPADYVFQREEDPKLLTTWQSIRRDDDGKITTKPAIGSDPDANVVLYWMAGTDKKEKHDGNFIDTYNRLGQMTTNISGSKGVKSPGGYASTSVPSDAGTYDAYWDIAAPALTNAHTEKAYANQGCDYQSSTEYTYTTANGGNTEFDMPISGSFIRICAMKNTYVVAHVLPGATNGAVYVLDETGSPIPFVLSGEPSSDAKRLGYITSLSNIGEDKEGGKTTSDGTIRIDFKANAGKEYFICAKDASISLARLEIHDWRHKPAKARDKLMVADNTTTNSTIIANAYDDAVAHDTYYRDANLTRTFAAEKWASLVLPFSLNEKKFEKIFGKNAKVLHFTDFDGNTCTLKFTRHFYNIIVAGRPVFVWPTKEVKNPDFKDITLQTKTVRNTDTPSGFSFVGSYDNANILRNDLYMNNNNVIKYINKDSTYPGMRSFIKNNNKYDFFTETPVAAGVKAVLLSFDDDEPDMPTGIEELVSAEFGEDVVVVTKTTKIYDLLGNVIGEGSDIKNLPTGVYIVNGKKYYVK